jgi:hypothetical protein
VLGKIPTPLAFFSGSLGHSDFHILARIWRKVDLRNDE